MKTRIIGIDYGLARIGIAYSDEQKIIATSHKTVQAEKKLKLTVKKVLSEIELIKNEKNCEISEIVLGMPLMLNGTMGVLADEVLQFAELMKTHISIPIITWDERLTSVQAERALLESSMTRKKRSKHIDAVSAIIILQSYLDSKE